MFLLLLLSALIGAVFAAVVYQKPLRDLWVYRGLTRVVSRDMDEATRSYLQEQVEKANEEILQAKQEGKQADLDTYLNLAFNARLLGDLVTAREALEVQLAGNPLHYTAWNSYGTVLEEMGELEVAEQAYRKAIETSNGLYEEYWRDLVVFLQTYRPERGAEVEELLTEGVKYAGQTSWFMVTLGDWYRANGDCDRAIDHYQVAVSLTPQNTDAAATLLDIRAQCAVVTE